MSADVDAAIATEEPRREERRKRGLTSVRQQSFPSPTDNAHEAAKNHEAGYQPGNASLDKYLREIGRVDLITAEEEVELARRIKNQARWR